MGRNGEGIGLDGMVGSWKEDMCHVMIRTGWWVWGFGRGDAQVEGLIDLISCNVTLFDRRTEPRIVEAEAGFQLMRWGEMR